MTSDVSVRPAQAHDRDAALGLAPRLTEGVAHWRDPAAAQRGVLGWVGDRFLELTAEDRTIVVAEVGSTVVGFAAAEISQHWTGERDAYIGELVVGADAEGRGVGTALVEAVTRWARQQGCACVTLLTGAANVPARDFYARLGFREEDIRLTLPLT